MAHVLVIDDDEGIRAALRDLLEDVGHSVMTTSDLTLARTILMICVHPLVVLVNSRCCDVRDLAGQPGVSLWQLPITDVIHSGIRVRHRFIVMTTDVALVGATGRSPHAEIAIPILAQPFDIHEVLRLIGVAECEIERDLNENVEQLEQLDQLDHVDRLRPVEVTHGRVPCGPRTA